MKTSISPKSAGTVGGIVLWLAIWGGLGLLLGKTYLFPGPVQVGERILEETGSWEFYRALGNSAFHIGIGWVGGLGIGFLAGCGNFYFPGWSNVAQPLYSVISTIPVVSFIIFLYLWIGSDALPTVVSGLIVFPGAVKHSERALRSVEEGYLQMAMLFQWTEKKKWHYLYLPRLKKYFQPTASSAMSLAWKAGLAAEVIALSPGTVGEQLYMMKVTLDMTGLLAYTISAIVVCTLMERGVSRLWQLLPGEI